jgi:hypothetical protein
VNRVAIPGLPSSPGTWAGETSVSTWISPRRSAVIAAAPSPIARSSSSGPAAIGVNTRRSSARSCSFKGPLPTGSRPNFAPACSRRGTTLIAAIRSSTSGSFWANPRRTHPAPDSPGGAPTSTVRRSSSPYRWRIVAPRLPSHRFTLNTTSSTLTGSPSWNRASGRRWHATVLPSGSDEQRSASAGVAHWPRTGSTTRRVSPANSRSSTTRWPHGSRSPTGSRVPGSRRTATTIRGPAPRDSGAARRSSGSGAALSPGAGSSAAIPGASPGASDSSASPHAAGVAARIAASTPQTRPWPRFGRPPAGVSMPRPLPRFPGT